MEKPSRKNAARITVQRLSDAQKKELNIPPQPVAQDGWNVWECGPSAFPWHYDQTEKCFLYEGDVKVITDDGEVTFKAGDFVMFPAGLSCRWEVHQKVRKVYKFE